jgi:hypothetical protein
MTRRPWRFCFAGACAVYCLLSPLAIYILTMRYGATTWRNADEPIPWPTHVIDGLFLLDLACTSLLIWLSRKLASSVFLLVMIGLIFVGLLIGTGVGAFWGGLWVSGQWL